MRIVIAHGCFDILHIGHVRMLRYARLMGDRLVVSAASDEHIRAHKGNTRPVNTLRDRVEVLSALKFVDEVICDVTKPGIDDVLGMIAVRKPAVYVKGAEYNFEKKLPERDCVEIYGGSVLFVPMEQGYSTTRTLEKLV